VGERSEQEAAFLTCFPKKREKLECMHNNPVRAGLVKEICDWPWSLVRVASRKVGWNCAFMAALKFGGPFPIERSEVSFLLATLAHPAEPGGPPARFSAAFGRGANVRTQRAASVV
jgi:hypothetical protein